MIRHFIPAGYASLRSPIPCLSLILALALISMVFPQQVRAAGTTLLTEHFDDSAWSSRGWYDNTNHGVIDTGEKYAGNGSLRYDWSQGADLPTGGGAVRHHFTASDSVYVSIYIRLGSGWVGSGLSYHPHLIYLLSDLDTAADPYSGLSSNYLDTYIEVNGTHPRFALQDGLNINYSNGSLPIDLTKVTEKRSVAGCNGGLGDSGTVAQDCYLAGGSTYNNGETWTAPISLTTGAWHHYEAYFRMNTINSAGKANADGIMKMWIDGNPQINSSTVVYRTGNQPTKKWDQIILGPYIGDGSPKAQSMWFDELTVGTDDPYSSTSCTITATAGPNGSISPSGAVSVSSGATKSFTITPSTGYTIADVQVDGNSVGAVGSYTFSKVTADHSISATFAGNIVPPTANAAQFNTRVNTILSGKLTGSDPNSMPLNYSIVTNGSLGKAVITNASTGAFTYTPNSNATGKDTFTFKVSDAKASSIPATVTINIASLTGIAISGPSSVAGGATATYSAISTYSDGSTKKVTPSWSLGSTTYASISTAGVLTAKPVTGSQTVTVKASYTAGGVKKAASQNITITISSAQLPSIVTNANAVVVPERGTMKIGVKLSSAPSTNVVVNAARISGEVGITITSGSSLTFTPSNWNSYQNVVLSSSGDGDSLNGKAVIRLSSGTATKTITAAQLDTSRCTTLLGLPDVDGAGTPGIAVLFRTPGTSAYYVYIKNAMTGSLIRKLTFGAGTAPLTMSLLDIAGKPNLVTAGLNTNSSSFEQITDLWSGLLYNYMVFSKLSLLDMNIISEIKGSGKSEPALLGMDPITGKLSIQIKETGSGALMSTVTVNGAVGQNVYPSGDLDSDGNPDLAIMLASTTGNCTVQGIDPTTSKLTSNVAFTSTGYLPRAMAVVPNFSGDNQPGIAVVSTNIATGATSVCVKDPVTGTQKANYSVLSMINPIAAAPLPVSSGDPKLAVLGTDSSTGNALVAVSDTKTGAGTSKCVFSNVKTPSNMSIFKAAGNGAQLYAVLGMDPTNTSYVVGIKNFSTGAFSTIPIP